jgi:hypothetical protein
MSDPTGGSAPLAPHVVWSDDYRTCVAQAVDARGSRVHVAFASGEPVLCAIARTRMEHTAIDALRAVLEV